MTLAPIPMLDRPPPADDATVYALAALMWRQGRDRLRQLGIGPEAFIDAEAIMLAAVLIANREFTPAECRVLWRDDGGTVPWYVVLDYTGSAAWAVSAIDRFARAYAARWLPDHLEWTARRIRTGEVRAEHAADDIDQLLSFIRPPHFYEADAI